MIPAPQPEFIIIDQFDCSMPIEFKSCRKHGVRLHFDNLCPGCMEDRFGAIDGL